MNLLRSCLLAGLLLLAGTATAQTTTDAEAKKRIEQTLRYYLDGGTNRDQALVTKAFQPEAQMIYLKDGATFSIMPIQTYLANIKPGPRLERSTRVVSIDVAGKAAQARVESEGADYRMVDFINLLEIDGEWKIVNKIFYRLSKTQTAASK
ncbi:nuclear transport factor 2 family protein [Hymenobacter sp. B81]|uniref:nuclear transport factor 2 family protein n=1 Tax=Hymenobacter sp. B81 TaxID=3344878 RepID=UPI0037DCB9D4